MLSQNALPRWPPEKESGCARRSRPVPKAVPARPNAAPLFPPLNANGRNRPIAEIVDRPKQKRVVHDTFEIGGRRLFGPVGRTLLVFTAVSALGLLLFVMPHVVALVALAHEVPNPWTVFDVALIGLPVLALAIAIGAIVALIQGRLLPLWVGLGLFVLDVLSLVGMFTTGLGVALDSNATIDFNEAVPFDITDA